MVYPEAIKYLESFINYEKIPAWPYEKSLKLKRIQGFLSILDNPHDGLRYIHIAGSKGKGSTCAFITYILREAGYKVGLYTSPHLSDFRERIRIVEPLPLNSNPQPEFEGMISKNELLKLIEKLKPAIEKYNRISKYGPLSFFEVYTALAFVYFKEKKVDFVVLETGLGGRLDATNVVDPLVCVITPISYEHTQKLGKTLQKIATEKSKIIKKIAFGNNLCDFRSGTKFSRPLPKKIASSGGRLQYIRPSNGNLPVVSAPQEKEALAVFRDRCKKTGARLFLIGKDVRYKKTGKSFQVRGASGTYSDLRVRLLGQHQVVNASVAVAAIEALRVFGITVEVDSLRRGLYTAVWPGRCEIISRKPWVVLDGAQNTASVRVLKDVVTREFKYKRLILVLGISNDKDIKGICHELYDFADEVIVTQARNPRATPAGELARYFTAKPACVTVSVKEAMRKAAQIATGKDLILVSGSLFVVGEARGIEKVYS
jgi:dihydrofolate synthase/folylpolyglutamate synthase